MATKDTSDGLTAFERAQLSQQAEHNARMEEIAARTHAAPAAAEPMTDDEMFHARNAARRGRDVAPVETTILPMIESGTGASFAPKIDHNKRVCGLENYTFPDGVDRKLSEGGKVPDGYTIGSQLHKQWKWSEFWQKDINDFVGRPLPKHYTPTARDVVAAAAGLPE